MDGVHFAAIKKLTQCDETIDKVNLNLKVMHVRIKMQDNRKHMLMVV